MPLPESVTARVVAETLERARDNASPGDRDVLAWLCREAVKKWMQACRVEDQGEVQGRTLTVPLVRWGTKSGLSRGRRSRPGAMRARGPSPSARVS